MKGTAVLSGTDIDLFLSLIGACQRNVERGGWPRSRAFETWVSATYYCEKLSRGHPFGCARGRLLSAAPADRMAANETVLTALIRKALFLARVVQQAGNTVQQRVRAFALREEAVGKLQAGRLFRSC